MTAGREALAEAARLELARVYGATLPAAHSEPITEERAARNRVRLMDAVEQLRAAGVPTSQIMAETGAEYALVQEVRRGAA